MLGVAGCTSLGKGDTLRMTKRDLRNVFGSKERIGVSLQASSSWPKWPLAFVTRWFSIIVCFLCVVPVRDVAVLRSMSGVVPNVFPRPPTANSEVCTNRRVALTRANWNQQSHQSEFVSCATEKNFAPQPTFNYMAGGPERSGETEGCLSPRAAPVAGPVLGQGSSPSLGAPSPVGLASPLVVSQGGRTR